MNTSSINTRKFKSEVTLRYQGKDYTFLYDFAHEEQDAQPIYFSWTEGNYSCDCNRSSFIAEYCNEDFPDLECGNTIELVSLKHIEVGIVDGSVALNDTEVIYDTRNNFR
jgi:hypothetical protein